MSIARIAGWGLAAVILALLAAAGAAVVHARLSLPPARAMWMVDGVGGPVRLFRDVHGIPHIFASSENDAFAALGIAHAQDRLWQMEMMRRAGAGRLSEVIGPAGLSNDRLMRTLGLTRAAERSLRALPPDTVAALEAYSRGVNHVLSHSTLPPELAILSLDLEPWQARDSLIVAALLSVQVSGALKLKRHYAAIAAAGHGDLLKVLLPGWEPAVNGDAYIRLMAQQPPAPSAAAAAPEAEDGENVWSFVRQTASNAWAVDATYSATGAPLLANDPHLRLSNPALWYLCRLEWPGLSLRGGTIPGLPFNLVGQNQFLAWGLTMATADTQDLVLERIASDTPDRYLVPAGSLPFEERQETIGVKGEAPVSFKVRATRHGPVVSDLGDDVAGPAPQGHVLALSFALTRIPDTTASAFHHLGHSSRWSEARQVLREIGVPVFNVMVADSGGTIALKTAGRVPGRPPGTGVLPRPGWLEETDGDEGRWLAFDDLPETVRPPDGWLANANQPWPADAAWRLGASVVQPVRYRWIAGHFGGGAIYDMNKMSALQMDVHAPDADLLLPLLLRARPRSPLGRDALAALARWDREMRADAPEPLLFAAWTRTLFLNLLGAKLAPHMAAFWENHASLTAAALRDGTPFCGERGTPATAETCDGILDRSLEEAVSELASRFGNDLPSWRWGDAHQAALAHPLWRRVPGLGDLLDLSAPTGGGFYTINRGAYEGQGDTPFAHVHGPGYRAVYDVASPADSHFMIATGQSGHLLNGRWRDFTSRWSTGGWITLSGDPTALLSQGARELTLLPPSPTH